MDTTLSLPTGVKHLTLNVIDPFVVYNKRGHKQIRKGTFIYMTYENIPKNLIFKHHAVNDYNQHLCGGWSLYKHPPFEEVDRVVIGSKPVGISHTRSVEEAEAKQIEITNKGKLCTFMKNNHNDLYFVTASPYGTLEEFFPNLDILIQDYDRCKLSYCANIIRKYKKVNFEAFHHGKFDRENHHTCITGLILGYPIENTISLIVRDEFI
jgi:hypothetical protein